MLQGVMVASRWVKRAVPALTLYVAIALWLYVRTRNATLAAILAALLSLCLYAAFFLATQRFPFMRAGSKRDIRAAKHYLLSLGEGEALAALLDAMRGVFPLSRVEWEDGIAYADYKNERIAIKLGQSHESQTVNANDIYAFHRRIAHKRVSYGVVLLLSRASGGSTAAAAQMRGPGVALVSPGALSRYVRRVPIPKTAARGQARAPVFPGDHKAERCFWAGFALACVYLVTALPWYLPAGICLCAYGCALRFRRARG